MIKKIICGIIVFVIIMSALVGCSEEKTGEETADTETSTRTAMTLSLWMPTDDSTTEEAKKLVENAINVLTQAKYNTAIELHLIPRSEYQETIDAKLEEVDKANVEKQAAEEARRRELKNQKNNSTQSTEETEDTAVETVINEYGISVTSYPEVSPTQLDIFFVSGFDKYSEYAYSNMSQSVDSELSGTSKILRSYIYPTFINAIYDFGTFAIPNNHPAGKYQYFLVNKSLMEEYDYNLKEVTSLLRSKNFIIDVGNHHLDDVVPLLGPVDSSGMVYWGTSAGSEEWSLISAQITDQSTYKEPTPPSATLDNAVYINTLKFMKELESYGYVGDGTLKEGQRFAVGVITADEETIKEYEDDYYISVYAKPVISEDDIYNSMFAVCQYSKSLSRSMEIITYLNTETELRTILQYGVEGVHWKYDEETGNTTIKILNDDYKMDINETGNVFMTYPGEDMPLEYWETYKEHNVNAVSSPFMKMPSYIDDENEEAIEELLKLNKEVKARIDAASFSELNSVISEIKQELADNEAYNMLISEEDEHSIVYKYVEWQESTY